MDIISGKQRSPLFSVLYGVPGVGKTTFAESTPRPLFLGPEKSEQVTSDRFPPVKSLAEFMGRLKDITAGKYKKNGNKTLVVDSITGMERIIHDEICKNDKNKKATMATACGGYGRAYDEAARRLWAIKEALETLQDKTGMDILIIGHSVKTRFIDPILQMDYDVYDMSLHKNGRRDCNSFFSEPATMVLFMNWANYKNSDEKFASSQGEREIYTEYRPSHLAKNRFGLPYRIEVGPEVGWEVIQEVVDQFYEGGGKEKIDYETEFDMKVQEFKGLYNEIKDEATQAKVNEYFNNTLEQTVEQNEFKKGLAQMVAMVKRLREIIANQ